MTVTEGERGLRSVADLAEENGNGGGDGLPADVDVDDDGQLSIAGTRPKLTLNAGGAKPTVSVAKIKSLKLPVTGNEEGVGEFYKGDTIRVEMDLVVVGVHQDDERRKGKVERTQRVHVFEPLSISVIEVIPSE